MDTYSQDTLHINSNPLSAELNAVDLWSAAREKLAANIAPGTYKTWIEPLKAKEQNNGTVLLSGPNNFFLNWVKNHFADEIISALMAVGLPAEQADKVDFTVDVSSSSGKAEKNISNNDNKPAIRNTISSSKSQTTNLLSGLGPATGPGRFTFDNFVVGDSNIYAFSAAKAMAAGESLGSNALFITSDHGLGKSHLSMALGNTFLKHNPRSRIFYVTAEDFTNEMTHSIRHHQMDEFKARYRQNCDILLMEEVQFLAGKEKIQSELCFTLDCLMEQGKKIIFTSPQDPKSIPRLGRSLRSRLSTALISPIGAPDYETRLNILLRKASSSGLKISRPVLEYVADRITSDVRQLESCLISLKAKSQLLGRHVDMEMARETLAYIFDDQGVGGVNPVTIREMVCRHFHLDIEVITSRDRSRRVSEARALGIYLSRHITGRTLEEIGSVFGRSHSSALYAINKLERELKKDPKLQGKIEFFNQQILK